MAARPPQLTGAEITQALSEQWRAPFLDLLAVFIESAPDPEVLREWASRHPDRYVEALEDLACLAGFSVD